MVVELKNFRLDNKIGEGGQAKVFRITNDLAIKIYNDKSLSNLNVMSLLDAIEFGSNLENKTSDYLFRSSSWPRDVIQSNGKVVGITMSLAPSSSYVKRPKTDKSIFLSFNHLIKPIMPALSGVVPDINGLKRVEILLNFLRLTEFLHSHCFILGDISGNNISWSSNSSQIFLMDCDSARRTGKPSALPQMETIYFTDPSPMPSYLEHQSSLDTDNYRIGLLVVAVLTKTFPLTPGKVIPKLALRELEKVASQVNLPSLPIHVKNLWTQLGLGSGLRPNSTEWIAAFN
jgi:serine/threonine protein kinase